MLVLLIVLLLMSFSAYGAVNSEGCIECHSNVKGVSHGSVSCTGCHSDIKDLPHEEKLPRPSCNLCHEKTAGAYRASIHGRKRLDCKACHRAHFPGKDKKRCFSCHGTVSHDSLPSKQKHIDILGCTGCHGKTGKGFIQVDIELKKGTIPKEVIDDDSNNVIDSGEWERLQSLLKGQVQGFHRTEVTYFLSGDPHAIRGKPVSCYDCHRDKMVFAGAKLKFSGKAAIEVAADPEIFLPRLPDIAKYKETVHGSNGIACRDCHASRDHVSDSVCGDCHAKVNAVYRGTRHAKSGATKCVDCHNPHSIKGYKQLTANERIAVCARCHGDYLKRHKWLPNRELHFKYLECSTCHSPGSTKSIVFRLGVRSDGKEKVLAYEDFAGTMGKNVRLGDMIDENMDKGVLFRELTSLYLQLQRKLGEKVYIDSSIIVTDAYHDYSVKSRREKVCTTCHSERAPFYDSMFLVVPEKDRLVYTPVKGTILSALPTSMFIDMCLLGEAKITLQDWSRLVRSDRKGRLEQIRELGFKWIDFLGILVMLIVLFLILLHGIARLIFRK